MTDRPGIPSRWQAAPAPEWRPVDTALWCYFFLPVIIFLPGFFTPVLALPVVALALAAGYYWLPRQAARPAAAAGETRRELAAFGMLALLAGAWAVLGGAGHVFFANPVDWVVRFAVLRDLVVLDWPPRYLDAGGNEFVLRTGLGYYLPGALLARFLGLARADSLLLAWTWLGVALFFAANFAGSTRQRLSGAALFIFASGLDIVGTWSKIGMLPWASAHLEWWAGRMQYSSNTTLLFWVPNHGFPGWIAAAWLWRFRDAPRFLVRLPILFLPVMLWAPLPALGLLPLAAVAVAVRWRECLLSRQHLGEFFKSLGLVIAPAALTAAYLLMSAATIDFSTTDAARAVAGGGSAEIENTVLFVALEAGVFAVFALLRERSAVLIACVLVLALLPLSHFGPNNDLLMRGSIPALTILWLVLIAELTAEPSKRALSRLMRATLAFLFMLGAVTAYQEIYRALTRRHWTPNLNLTVPESTRGFPPHYFASAANRLIPLLNRTQPLPYRQMNRDEKR